MNDTYEFEISFYDKESLSPSIFSKFQQQQGEKSNDLTLKRLNYGKAFENDSCSRVYFNCSARNTDACLISTSGYPGIYLKNQQCQYYIKNDVLKRENSKNQKLIVINDYLQIDATICHFDPTNNKQSQAQANSYFCDNGPRSSKECNDYLTVYDGIQVSNITKGLILMKQICGMGRLPKIVTSKNAIILELTSSSDGLFANSGLLFYAISQKNYLDKFELFNKFDKSDVKNQYEFNSIKAVERLQIDNCNSDMNSCIIRIDEDLLEEIYTDDEASKKLKRSLDENVNFYKLGYLFNVNQYQPNDFTLKYVLETNSYNTIAIFLDKYQPFVSNNNNSQIGQDACKETYLSIETIYNNHEFEEHPKHNDFEDHSSSSKPKTRLNLREKQSKNLLVKICDRADFDQTVIKYFLIKTSVNQIDDEDATFPIKLKRNLLISYFSSNPALVQASRLFDFKLSFEYLNFDWQTYQENSVCDFVYNLNLDDTIPITGTLVNPKASIFYKTADEFLKCKYRLVAKPNQYIKLSVNSISFEMDEEECSNVYFANNKVDSKAQHAKCSKMSKKILIKELKHPWNGSPENDIFYDYVQDFDTETGSMDDNYNQKLNLDTKLCLCKKSKDMEVYYVSKYDAIEIEYFVKKDKENEDSLSMKRNDFHIEYEFVNRNCNKLQFSNLKTNLKGKLVYLSANYGTQGELSEFLNKTKSEYNYQELVPAYLSDEAKIQKEINNLKSVLFDNLNFNCRFNINAPKNSFIHVEFSELYLPETCEHNSIRLYSNFSNSDYDSLSLDGYFVSRPSPFIRLCPPSNKQESSFANLDDKKENMVVAEFFDESIANSSYSCFSSKNKICFLTSDLSNELNPLNTRLKHADFRNNLVVEIVADKLEKFYFEIKYHFYKIDFNADLRRLQLLDSFKRNSKQQDYEQYDSLQSDDDKILKNENCDFKCFTSKMNGSLPICLDETLVCDDEVNCVYNDLDEANCRK